MRRQQIFEVDVEMVLDRRRTATRFPKGTSPLYILIDRLFVENFENNLHVLKRVSVHKLLDHLMPRRGVGIVRDSRYINRWVNRLVNRWTHQWFSLIGYETTLDS